MLPTTAQATSAKIVAMTPHQKSGIYITTKPPFLLATSGCRHGHALNIPFLFAPAHSAALCTQVRFGVASYLASIVLVAMRGPHRI